MIPKMHTRGTSFKGACAYILHDPKTTTRDRVLFNDTCNTVLDADNAWVEMFATARDQSELKKAAGQDARGRKNTKPVLHISLSWAADEKPDHDHMKSTARSALDALGLSEHQAVMAAHGDKDHLHIHIVVNTIHPLTGMTAPLKYTKERLSRWAEAYERIHGIHCEQRIENNRKRDEAVRAREASALLMNASELPAQAPLPYVPVKYQGPNRREWFDRKEISDRMKRLRAELDLVHAPHRAALRQRQDAAFKDLQRNTRAALEHARAGVRQNYKPQWREMYRQQKRELRFVAQTATLFERAVFVFAQRDRLGRSKPISFRTAAELIRRPSKLLARLEAVYERERRTLARTEKADLSVYHERIWQQHKVRIGKLKDEQASERTAQREDHFIATRAITLELAKASLSAESQATAANQNLQADTIKEQMHEWRKRNQDRDFGREM